MSYGVKNESIYKELTYIFFIRMKNYYTSFAFGVAALWTPGSWIQTWLTCLMGTSILQHAKKHDNYRGRKVISIADHTIAHGIAFYSLWDALHVVYCTNTIPYLIAYWFCLSYMFMIYYVLRLSHCGGEREEWWHGSTHIVSSIGMYMLYRAKNEMHMF